MSARELIEYSVARVDRVLDELLLERKGPAPRLESAMHYALLGGGKRLRPTLVYTTGSVLGIEHDRLDAAAAAIEMIHAYSLVHDDLPAMDDDDLRRGRPTVHCAYDEATAILAGDALQTLAFETLASSGENNAVALVACLARASGAAGMVGGQALDLAAVGQKIDLDALVQVHRHKTGALISAAVEMAALVKYPRTDERVVVLRAYSEAIGLAFQIHDDVLDVVGDTAVIGKTQGADAEHDKPTYPALLGLEGASHRAHELIDEACDVLAPLGESAEPLVTLARFMIARDH
ncbi:Farnesyl diphosphate synthase [Halomonadaceae bacterium LMG 33818]|uniref:(2E,6E)-farnesyl diphosphate synthase n=1 Tax=Cernens ardua TaxID=3402176 RepID=UPI003EDBFA31